MTGFKSFAAKTVLELEPGLTAVVGPNGSGKSNLADAVRWVMGEQSKGKLRLEDRAEIIFAGTDSKARASFAEVSLVLDNRSGMFGVDSPEVEVSRRLYRGGDSEFRLFGRPAKLSEVQSLLTGAGISPGGYSVIGQGMIDGLLLSSPAERKLLFDEAAGIRGPELSRESALRKLTATTANLVRLRDIVAELEPRLKSLERVAAATGGQAKLAQRVAELRQRVVASRLAAAAAAASQADEALQAATQQLDHHEAAQTELSDKLQQLRDARLQAQQVRQHSQHQLDDLLGRQQVLIFEHTTTQTQLTQASIEAEAAAALAGGLAQLTERLKTATQRAAETARDLARNTAALERANHAVEHAGQDVAEAQRALVDLREDQADSTRDQYLGHALEILKALARGLHDQSLPDQDVKLLVHKAGRLLSHAARRGPNELVTELQQAQQKLEVAMAKRDTAVEHQTNITITRRSLEIDQTYQSEMVNGLNKEQASLQERLKTGHQAEQLRAELTQRNQARQAELDSIEHQVQAARRHLTDLAVLPEDYDQETLMAAALERCRAELQAAAEARTAAQQAGRDAQESERAAHTLAASWGIDLPPAPMPASAAPESLASLATQLTAAEATLAAQVDATTEQIEEYRAVEERFRTMTNQIADLQAAQQDLEAVINELDTLIQARFKDNMKALAEQFSTYFGRLFAGGTASLVLEQADDGAYGIVIKASPAGKRLSRITALSGGERTLTGIALLAAILRVNPSPFVVLDEVDAALDEANSGRLADILAELAEQSQLIVVTHNRQTMQAARLLYGVTLSPQQASHVLPLRLDEATAIAAR